MSVRRAYCIRWYRWIERYGPGGLKHCHHANLSRQNILRTVEDSRPQDSAACLRCIQKIVWGQFKWEEKKKANAMMQRYVLRCVLDATKYVQHNQRYLPLQSIENSEFMIVHVRSHKAYTLILKYTHTHTHTHTHRVAMEEVAEWSSGQSGALPQVSTHI